MNDTFAAEVGTLARHTRNGYIGLNALSGTAFRENRANGDAPFP